jgi:LmbE family N-acetylglucosaminyl deacetylase
MYFAEAPIAAACALCAILLTAAPVAATDSSMGAAAALPPLDATTSLLVVAPHPDDETLCCAGVIQRVVQAGGRVSVLWITSGDGSILSLGMGANSGFPDAASARALGLRRMREARTASALLGVPAQGQLFLGYPDGGLLALLTDHRVSPYKSGFTAAAAVPYPEALFPGHRYSGESLEQDFAAVLARVQPTVILAPSPLDSHPDHEAAGLLTIAVSRSAGLLPRVRYWIVHGGDGWPSPRGLVPGVPLTPPPRGSQLDWTPFVLEPAAEDKKLAAVRAYETQLRMTAPFLLAFVRSSELFATRPTPPAAQR